MGRFSNWLVAQSKGWLVVLCVVIFVLFMIFVLPNQAAKADEYAQGMGSPDTSFYYSPEKLFEMAEAYGEKGRQAYVRARFSFDLIFPLVYGAFLVTLISWLAGRAFDLGSRWRYLNLIPVVGVIFDLLENTATSLVMAGFPERRLVAAQLAPVFTLVKWGFVYGSFFVLAIVLAIWVYKILKRGS